MTFHSLLKRKTLTIIIRKLLITHRLNILVSTPMPKYTLIHIFDKEFGLKCTTFDIYARKTHIIFGSHSAENTKYISYGKLDNINTRDLDKVLMNTAPIHNDKAIVNYIAGLTSRHIRYV